jgi:UPF0755 protein
MRKLSTILAILFAVGLIAGMYVGVLYFGEDIRPGTPKVEVRVNPGMYLNDVQKMLVDEGVLKHPRLFRWVAVATGKDRRVQAGRYVFLKGMSISRMLHKLSHAEFEVTRLTVPEGFMLREISQVVERDVEIDSARFFQTASDPALVRQLGINAPTLEGYLFPDTYLLSWRGSWWIGSGRSIGTRWRGSRTTSDSRRTRSSPSRRSYRPRRRTSPR